MQANSKQPPVFCILQRTCATEFDAEYAGGAKKQHGLFAFRNLSPHSPHPRLPVLTFVCATRGQSDVRMQSLGSCSSATRARMHALSPTGCTSTVRFSNLPRSGRAQGRIRKWPNRVPCYFLYVSYLSWPTQLELEEASQSPSSSSCSCSPASITSERRPKEKSGPHDKPTRVPRLARRRGRTLHRGHAARVIKTRNTGKDGLCCGPWRARVPGLVTSPKRAEKATDVGSECARHLSEEVTAIAKMPHRLVGSASRKPRTLGPFVYVLWKNKVGDGEEMYSSCRPCPRTPERLRHRNLLDAEASDKFEYKLYDASSCRGTGHARYGGMRIHRTQDSSGVRDAGEGGDAGTSYRYPGSDFQDAG